MGDFMQNNLKIKIGDVIYSKNNTSAEVINIYRSDKNKYKIRVVVLFEWGEEKDVNYYQLMKNGLSEPDISRKQSKLYTIYKRYDGIIQRCTNKNNTSYKRYGARGIECKFNTFWEFFNYVKKLDRFKEVLENPDKYEIDRINTNGSYEVGNLRWATISENQRNKTNNTIYDIIDMYNGSILYTGIKTDCENYIYNKTKCKTSICICDGLFKWNIGLKNGFRLRVVPHDKDLRKEYDIIFRNYLNSLGKLDFYNLICLDTGKMLCNGTINNIKNFIKNKYGEKPKINSLNYKDYKFLTARNLKIEYVDSLCRYDIEALMYNLK